MKMGRIDDPYDAARSQNQPKESENVVGELALRFTGVVFPLAAAANTVRDYLSGRMERKRVQNLLDALKLKIDLLETQVQGNADQVGAVSSKVESPEFHAALVDAIEETRRTYDHAKVSRFAEIVGNSLSPEYDTKDLEEVSSFIRAVSQLGDRDIRTLKLLHSVYQDVLKVNPNMHDPNAFTERIDTLFKEISESGIGREQFYAHCARLSGFGLAMEVPRNPGRMSPGDYCFRPTSLGLKLLFLLGSNDTGD